MKFTIRFITVIYRI